MTCFRCSSILLSVLLVLSTPSIAKSIGAEPKAASLTQLDAKAAAFSSYLLPNGFKVILVPFPTAANTRVELLVKTGSKLEGYGETGMAHLLEHMLFKSAGQRRNLKSDLTALGAIWNGTTNADRTSFFETVAAEPEKIDEAIHIEADRFIRASFTKEDLASEMSVVRNELEQNDSDPNSLVMRALQRQSYFWHGYSRPTIGARTDIEDAPFSVLQAFHKKHYRSDNAALIVSGNFDTQRVLDLASLLFSQASNPTSPKIGSWTREETRAITNRSELFLPTGKTIAASAWKLPGSTERQTYAFELAADTVCDQDWGSLRKELVLERKIAITTACGAQIQADYSLMLSSATAGKEANAETLSQALHDHIETAAAKGIGKDQLERARLTELNAFERLETSHEALASMLSKAEVAGDWRLYFWQRDTVKTLTLDEVNAAFRKWAVGVNRSDVLLRNADGIEAPRLPNSTEVKNLLAGKDWPATTNLADPIPTSANELAKATIMIPLDGTLARAALLSRQTQGDLAWIVLNNDYGNESALSGRRTAGAIANILMNYGGAGLSRDELSAKMDALQARWSMSLGGIALEAPRRNIDSALDILLSVWTSPALPKSEFERIKAAAIARIEANFKDPIQVAASATGMRFDNYPDRHPFKPHSMEQQLAEYETLSFSNVSSCVDDFSGIAQIRLAMVGNFTPQDVQSVWSRLRKLPKAMVPYERVKSLEAPSVVDTTSIDVAMPERPNASIAGSTLLRITDNSPDFPALRIAVKVFGGDADSRIWKKLREREGLAYSVGMNLSGNSFEPRSRLMIQASAASDKAEAAQVSLKEELTMALEYGFSEQEVERAKRAWLQERKTSLRSERTFADDLAQGLYTGRDYAWLVSFDESIARLTAKEVSVAFRKYLAEAPIVWMIGRGS
jgi:zinc protease